MDWGKMKSFDPALVCCFEAQSPTTFPSGDDAIRQDARVFMFTNGQIWDLFQAYCYAETLLEIIREKQKENEQKEKEITGVEVIAWLDGIHRRAGKTLLSEHKMPAGEVTQQQIFRWVHDSSLPPILIAWASGRLTRAAVHLAVSKIEDRPANEDLQSFMDLLELVGKRTDVVVNAKLLDRVDPRHPTYRGRETLMRLAHMHHLRLLTKEQETTLKRIVKLAPPPDDLPRLQQDFAEKTAKAWNDALKDKRQKQNDEEQNAEEQKDAEEEQQKRKKIKLAADAFYQITENHAYCDGNGRVATVFMNLMLVSLGCSNVVMRLPNERNDKTTSYYRAVQGMQNDNLEPLCDHLLSRFNISQTEFEFLKEAGIPKLVELRVQICKGLESLGTRFADAFWRSHVAPRLAEARDPESAIRFLTFVFDSIPKPSDF